MKKLCYVVAAVMLLASCGETPDDFGEVPSTSAELKLSGHITPPTVSRVNADGFEQGDKVGVYVFDETLEISGNISDNVAYSYDSASGLLSAPEGSEAYWNSNTPVLNVVAYYPYNEELQIYNGGFYRFAVATDQSKAVDFYNSDILSATAYNLSLQTTPVELQFNHLLSKVTIELVVEGEMSDEDFKASISEFTIGGLATAGTVNIANNVGNVSSDEIATVTPYAAEGLTYSAIVVPQNGSEMRVRLTANGNNYIYGTDVNFESGYEYKFILTITPPQQMSLKTIDIKPWKEGVTTEGSMGNVPIEKIYEMCNSMYSTDNNGYLVPDMHYCGQIPYFWCTDEGAYVMEPFVRNISEGNMSPDLYYGYTGYNLYFFQRYYKAINNCNNIIDNLNKCADIGEEEYNKVYAEVRFMRAYYHWMLVRLYGPLPMPTEYKASNDVVDMLGDMTRPIMRDCVSSICQEIRSAIDYMPDSNVVGKPSKVAALAIISRVYLLAASPLYDCNTELANWRNANGEQIIEQNSYASSTRWLNAMSAAKECIDMCNSLGYSLLQPESDDFEDIVTNIRKITTTYGPENPENLWAIENPIQWYGKCALPGRWGGWNGRFSLPLGFVNEFFMADGSEAPELESWFADKQFSEEAGNGTIAGTFHMFVGREPRFYANIHFPNQRLNYQGPYVDFSQDAEGYGIVDFWYNGLSGHKYTAGDKNTSGLSVRKNIPLGYWSNKSDMSNNWSLNVPFPVIRLAEVYLNYAEAANEFYGESDSFWILHYLNAVRERAGLPKYESYTTQDDMREKIRHERMIELCYEGQRWFDVRRWFIAHGENGAFNHKEYGFDMTKGSSPTIDNGGSTCTDPEFFTMVEVANKNFEMKHYFMPLSAEDAAALPNIGQAPFY